MTQYNMIWYNTLAQDTIQYNDTIRNRYSTVQYNMVHYNTVRHHIAV